jgi:hypothetical protein
MDADQVIMLTTKVWSTTAAMAPGGTMVLHWKKKMTPMAIAAEPPGKLQHFIVCKLLGDIWFAL